MVEDQKRAVIRMATIEFDVNDIGKYMTLKRFEELITDLGMESERKSSAVVVDITPDRPELLNFTELMRALLMLDSKVKPQKDRYKVSGRPTVEIKVSKSVSSVRPYMAALIVKDVNLEGNALKYMVNFSEKICDTYGRKRRKLAIGMHNIDSIKHGLVYEVVKAGRLTPIDSETEMEIDSILKKHPKGIEYRDTIPDGQYPVLRDSEKILALIPIINSRATKVSGKTRNLLVDITGTDIGTVERISEIFNCIFVDMGAKVGVVSVDYGAKRLAYPKGAWKDMRITAEDFKSLTGVNISSKRIAELAARMGHLAVAKGSSITVHIPPYRTDILHERDIIEDVAIAYGYNNIEPRPVVGHFVGKPSSASVMHDSISKFFVGCGFTEAVNPYLTNEKAQFDNMNSKPQKNVVGLDFSKVSGLTIMRMSALPMLLQNVGDSMSDTMPQRLFEYGKVFSAVKGGVLEKDSVAFISVHSKANLSEAKGIVEAFAKHIGQECKIERNKDCAFIDGRCASVTLRDKRVGTFGEIHPSVLNNFGIDEPVMACELVLNDIHGEV